jgi:ABC-type bacteriocin/lantibiotic exporter with double-glycine peptidase domain
VGRRNVAALLIVLGASGAFGLAVFGATAGREEPVRVLLAAWRGARFLEVGEGVRQRRFNDCGPAALAHSLRMLGASGDYPDPECAIELTETGCGFDQLVREANRRGFSAEVLRIEPRALGRVDPPAILHLDYGHFVVYEGWTPRGRILVHDPGLGRVSYSPERLARHFGGYLLVFGEPGTDAPPDPSARSARSPELVQTGAK